MLKKNVTDWWFDRLFRSIDMIVGEKKWLYRNEGHSTKWSESTDILKTSRRLHKCNRQNIFDEIGSSQQIWQTNLEKVFVSEYVQIAYNYHLKKMKMNFRFGRLSKTNNILCNAKWAVVQQAEYGYRVNGLVIVANHLVAILRLSTCNWKSERIWRSE